MDNIKKYLKVLLPLLLCIIGSGLFIIFGKVEYEALKLPPLAPKNFMFTIAWSIIYLIFAYSLINLENNKRIYFLYIYVLALHLLWNFFFFFFGSFIIGLIVLLLTDLVSVLMVYYMMKEEKKYLYLNMFYLIWLTLATYLNIGIMILN